MAGPGSKADLDAMIRAAMTERPPPPAAPEDAFVLHFTKPVHGVRIFLRDGQFCLHGVNQRGEVVARAEQPADWPPASHITGLGSGAQVFRNDFLPLDPNAGIPSA